MSHRPIEAKKVNRLRKALRRTPQARMDLVQFLIDRKHASTKAKARQMILDGKVMYGSHRVGRVEIELLGRKEWVLDPYIPAERKDELVVLP